MEQRKRAGRMAGAAIVAIVVILAAIWLGHRVSSMPAAPGGASSSPGTAAGDSSSNTASSAAMVGASDPFAGLSCGARQYQGNLSLSVTLTQPVERKADLTRYLAVIDEGAAPARDSGQSDGSGGETGSRDAPATTRTVQSGDATVSGKQLQGSWVIGDNPRVLFFPYVLPQRRYTVRLSAELPAAGGGTLRQSAHCQVDTDAMPPAFYFASRGVVLPAGQNGGLPVATVNMSEVDVQFLRIARRRFGRQ